MRFEIENPRVGYLMVVCLLLMTCAAEAQLLCNVQGGDGGADSGFGAGPGTYRGFSTIQSAIMADCMVDGSVWVTGVTVQVTESGGSSTMPIEYAGVFLAENAAGPPGSTPVFLAPQQNVVGVPTFPQTQTTELAGHWMGVAQVDINGDGLLDIFLAPDVSLSGDATPDQFLAYSRTGTSVPCFTRLLGDPFENCLKGDPNFTSLGVGVSVAASVASFSNGLFVKTNNPLEDPDGLLRWKLVRKPEGSDGFPWDLEMIIDPDNVMCLFEDVTPGDTGSCLATQDWIDQWPISNTRVRISPRFSPLTLGAPMQERLLPAHLAIFLDGFESGDTTAWSASLP